MKIIGLAGPMGVGKSSIGKVLMTSHRFVKRAFADAVRDEVSEVLEIPRVWTYSKNRQVWATAIFPEDRMSIREVLQFWGTDYRRAQDPDYWVKRMTKWMFEAQCRGTSQVVIDDVRFENEARYVRSQGGLVVRLHPYPGWIAPQKAALEHVSERPLPAGLVDLEITDRVRDDAARIAQVLAGTREKGEAA